jgi:crotonobetainyl-CoA:carnitine CoA-transferase CaiB-like acyl-CoA transferase
VKVLPVERLPARAPGGGFDLLAGVRVLDLTHSIAGPYATMLLGDFGAEVIKVERPGGGDDSRHWGPPFLDGESLWFLCTNRNKRSIALDYARAEGRAVLHDIARRSDIAITNQVARVQGKLGTDYDSLRAARPDIVYVAITGFGMTGERRDQLGYDIIAEGYSGVMDMTGERDREPQKIGTPAADMLAGMDAAFAAVAALHERARTGRGRRIDVSLVESMTRLMTPYLTSYLGTGEVPRRSGAKDSVIAVCQTFDTADEPITLILGNENLWRRFWHAVGRPEVVDDARYPDNGSRRAHRAELVAEIQALLSTRPRADWLALFAEAQVPAGPINRIDQVSADEALLARGLFYRIDRATGPPLPQVNTGTHIDGAANDPHRPPPALGADTDWVLRELLGYDEEKLEALRALELF